MSIQLEVIQWLWDLKQNPFQSVASYYPLKRKLKCIRDISWHTPNNTVSSLRPAVRAHAGWQGPFDPGFLMGRQPGLCLWGCFLGSLMENRSSPRMADGPPSSR